MIRLLGFAAAMVVLLWFAPWWALAPLGIGAGWLQPGRARSSALRYLTVSFVVLFALTWIIDAHSGSAVGHLLSSELGAPKWMFYCASAFILASVVAAGALAGSSLSQLKKKP